MILENEKNPLKRRIVLYIFVRLILATVVLGLAAVFVFFRQWETFRGDEYLDLVALTYLLMGLSAAGLAGVKNFRRFAYLQLFVDTAIVTALVSRTGGVSSVFSVLYFMTIVASAYLVYRKGALLIAGANALAFVAIGIFQVMNLTDSMVDNALVTPLYAELLIKVFGFFLVAVLAGELSEQLRKTGVQLLEEEAHARALEQELSVVVQSIRSGLAVIGGDGMLRSSNAPALMLFPKLSQLEVGEVIPEWSTDAPVWEIDVQHSNEAVTRVLITRTPMDDGASLLTMEDVSDLRKVEELARKEERFTAVGHLAAAIAHEVRNPLASLSGAVQMMKPREDDEELLKIVTREINRLSELVTRFLQSTRSTEFLPVPTDLEELVKEVVETFAQDPQYSEKVNVVVEFQMMDPIALDRERIRQILWNLLLNAAQAMTEGGRILVGGVRIGERVRMMVTDEGVGIDGNNVNKLFDPFYTTRVGGTGLGLATVERCTREHGGEVWVQSEPGVGTTFAVWLPMSGNQSHSVVQKPSRVES